MFLLNQSHERSEHAPHGRVTVRIDTTKVGAHRVNDD